MMGRNPLWVARQHGHSISTLLSIYAAWVEGALDVDVAPGQRVKNLPSSASLARRGESFQAIPL